MLLERKRNKKAKSASLELQELESKSQREIKILQEQYQNEKSTELDKQKTDLESKFAIEKQNLKQDFEAKLLKQQNELRESEQNAKHEHEQTMKETITLMKSKHQAEVNEIKTQYCTTIESLNQSLIKSKNEHLEQVQMINSSHQESIREMKEKHELDIVRSTRKFKAEKEAAVEELRRTMEGEFASVKQKELEVLKNVLSNKNKKQSNELSQLHEKEMNEMSLRVKALEHKISEERHMINSLQDKLSINEEKQNLLVAEHTTAISKIKQQHQLELDSLSKQHVAHLKEEKELWANESKSLTLEAVQSEKDALQKKLLMDYEEKTRSLKNEHMEQINSLERRMTENERKIYAEMDQKVSDLRQKYDADRESLLLKHEKAMLEYNEKSSTTLLNSQQRWQDEIAKYNKMLREKEDLLKDVYNEKKEEIATLRQEFQQSKSNC